MLDMANKQILPAAIKYDKRIMWILYCKESFIGIEGGAEEKLYADFLDITNSLMKRFPF